MVKLLRLFVEKHADGTSWLIGSSHVSDLSVHFEEALRIVHSTLSDTNSRFQRINSCRIAAVLGWRGNRCARQYPTSVTAASRTPIIDAAI